MDLGVNIPSVISLNSTDEFDAYDLAKNTMLGDIVSFTDGKSMINVGDKFVTLDSGRDDLVFKSEVLSKLCDPDLCPFFRQDKSCKSNGNFCLARHIGLISE